MPPDTHRVHTEYVLVKSMGPKVFWAESRVQGTEKYFCGRGSRVNSVGKVDLNLIEYYWEARVRRITPLKPLSIALQGLRNATTKQLAVQLTELISAISMSMEQDFDALLTVERHQTSN
ncbi:hypothetical protein TNCV_561811 [Trichonephila clavipes]|uniref:Uncharacterized protein n=1 Tax=Trichonephila clavipes TaxID=2585209 RepID=A0A8X6VF23_TRICX|nr:hypothetical protein TNCV_561811 [Trichonephila clavipes]